MLAYYLWLTSYNLLHHPFNPYNIPISIKLEPAYNSIIPVHVIKIVS